MSKLKNQAIEAEDGMSVTEAVFRGYVTTTVVTYVEQLQKVCHALASEAGWWNDPETGKRVERNTGELLMLCVSELAEAMEADRKSLKDDHLPQRDGLEVELADCVIRIFDLAGARGLDLGGAMIEKLRYNITRADHKPENRLKDDGKKC